MTQQRQMAACLPESCSSGVGFHFATFLKKIYISTYFNSSRAKSPPRLHPHAWAHVKSYYSGQMMRLRDFVVCIVSSAAVKVSFAMRKSRPADSRVNEVDSQWTSLQKVLTVLKMFLIASVVSDYFTEIAFHIIINITSIITQTLITLNGGETVENWTDYRV